MESVNPLLRMNGDDFCRCRNPFWTVQFEFRASGTADADLFFRMQTCTAWALRRVTALLERFRDSEALKILREAK